MNAFNNLLRSARIWVLLISILGSLIFITNITGINPDKDIGLGNGLDYGIDFAGGTQIWLKLENPVEPDIMILEKTILEERLNAIGLKDIPVQSYGDQYIIVKIAKASPEEIRKVEDILKQQAKFEQRIDGELAITGTEISVDLSSRGSGVYPDGRTWYLGVQMNQEGGCRFGKVAYGKFYGIDNPNNRPVDLFVDRPENTTILMTEESYELLDSMTSSISGDDFYFGDTAAEVIVNRSRVPVLLVYSGENINKTIAEFVEYQKKGFVKTIIAEDDTRISSDVMNMIEDLGIDSERIPLNDTDRINPVEWIKGVTGLKSSPRLNFDTEGKCVYNAQLTGGAATSEEAEQELLQNKVWLTSGDLPEKAYIDSKSQVLPSLGAQFLRYSLLTGLLGIVCVSIVIFLRYRKPFIVIPTIITGFSEILILLGVASIINWEIDIPAIAGIVAALGTGVDNQIVITDETIERRRDESKRSISVTERIRRAFFIIFTSAATIIAVMLPLMTFVAGTLKGFALTTILGVLIGVFITRPAYAKIVEELVKETE